MNDTIAALATAPGQAALAVIRISGPDTFTVLSTVFFGKHRLQKAVSHRLLHGYIKDGDTVIDEVTLAVYRAPRGFTGEDAAEIFCHGSGFITSRILALLWRYTRPAQPGEFTRRAFLNNKLDLTAAEAVSELISARSENALASSLTRLQGGLRNRVDAMLGLLRQIRITLELAIDFAEQGLDEPDGNALHEQLSQLQNGLKALCAGEGEGRIIREGYRVVLAGPPNAGKSSLFNAFLQSERALVTAQPGTTRDYLEEEFLLHGVVIRLFDTAGLRTADQEAERLGVERSLDLVDQADLVLWVTAPDAEAPTPEFFKPWLHLFNKAEDPTMPVPAGALACSARLGLGLDAIKAHLAERLRLLINHPPGAPLLANARQAAAARSALASVKKAVTALDEGLGWEFIAFDLNEAAYELGQIIGRQTSDDLLDSIFSNFCIGK